MKKLNDKEQRYLDEYIKKEMNWMESAYLSSEVKDAIYNTFEFQVCLLKMHFKDLKFELHKLFSRKS